MKLPISGLRILIALGLGALAVVLAMHVRAGQNVEGPVRKVLDDQVEAWNRGDLDGFMRGYWKSDRLTFFSDDNVQQGWQETYDRYQRRYRGEGKEMGTLKFDELHIDPTGPKSALVRGRWELTFKEDKPRGGLFTLLLREEDAGWVIVHDHTSAKAEAPLPAPAGDR